MRKFYLLLTIGVFCMSTFAQVASVQGVPMSKSSNQIAPKLTATDTFAFDDIDFWAGEGQNKAAMTIQWNVDGEQYSKVWGYKWDGEATGYDMMQAIAAADSRLYYLFATTQYGIYVCGIGYDQDYDDDISFCKTTTFALPQNGKYETAYETYQDWKASDPNDYWQNGTNVGFWNYYTKEEGGDFTSSMVGNANRNLQNNSWDFYNYSPDYNQATPVALTMSAAKANENRYTDGIFLLNQDWFGHRNSSINFLKSNGTFVFDAYRKANTNENGVEALGCTAAYATIYGNKVYAISKQAQDGGDNNSNGGGRLVIANAKTLEKIKGIADLNGADGRTFLALNETIGYIGTTNGIHLFDMETLTVGEKIEGTSGEIGVMYRVNNYVFATISSGVIVINATDNTVNKTIAANGGSVGNITVSIDGSVWIPAGNKLVRINPNDLTTTSFNIPSNATLPNDGSWAWIVTPFFASHKTNTLYWYHSKKVFKFDYTLDTPQPEEIYDLTDSGWGLYDGAANINPVNDHIFLYCGKGWSNSYCVFEIDTEGNKIGEYALNDAAKNYWFPEMPFFTDNFAPVLNYENAISLTAGNTNIIDLNAMVSDIDNYSVLTTKTITSIEDETVLTATIENSQLVIEPLIAGNTDIIVRFNSNGKTIDATFNATVLKGGDGINEISSLRSAYFNHNELCINGCKGFVGQLFTINGNTVASLHIQEENFSTSLNLPKGVYVLAGYCRNEKISIKIIVQ